MVVKERERIGVTEILKIIRLLQPSKLSSVLRARTDILFQLASEQAIRSFDPEQSKSVYVIPIGVYLDTTNSKVIKEANAFWVRALAEEGFAVIGEREVAGSWFKVFLAGTREPNASKRGPSKLKKHADKFLKDFGEVVRVVVMGTTILTPAPPVQPPKPPTPIVVVMSAPEATDEWGKTLKQLGDVAEKSDKIVGGALAFIELAKKKRKDDRKKESEEED
jgi:hypothetical protein